MSKRRGQHGGKRAGAGRPSDPSSIRSQVKEAAEKGYHHSYSAYEVWRENYICEHAHKWVIALVTMRDPSQRDAGRRDKTFISKHFALKLAHLPKDKQITLLKNAFPDLLHRVASELAKFKPVKTTES